MLIGYVRVSKADGSQSLALQQDALIAAGVDATRIYEDLASGRHDARPGLAACLKALQPGNTLVIWKLDRLGRNLRHLVATAEDLRDRGIGLKVLAGAGAQIDTTTANGRLAFGIFAAFAEFERELITERTRAGLEAARARGRRGGRPRKMDLQTLQIAIAAMSDRKTVAAEVAKRLGITSTTLYYYLNENPLPSSPNPGAKENKNKKGTSSPTIPTRTCDHTPPCGRRKRPRKRRDHPPRWIAEKYNLKAASATKGRDPRPRPQRNPPEKPCSAQSAELCILNS